MSSDCRVRRTEGRDENRPSPLHGSHQGFLIDDVEALPAADRNCAYLHFTHPDWIAGHSDHDKECAAIVAKLRAYYGESVADPAWEPLLRRLREESPLFVRLWDQADVSTDPGRVKRIRSLHVGDLSLRTITMLLQESPRTRVVVYQPEDRTTRERPEELANRISRGAIDGPANVRRPRLTTSRTVLRALLRRGGRLLLLHDELHRSE